MKLIKESDIRVMVRKCIREMIDGHHPYENEYPEELDGIFADSWKKEDDFWKDYYEDQIADQEISRQKAEDCDWYY